MGLRHIGRGYPSESLSIWQIGVSDRLQRPEASLRHVEIPIGIPLCDSLWYPHGRQ